MNPQKHNAEYLLMKTTDILAKLLDDDYQKNNYNKLTLHNEAKWHIMRIESYLKGE